MGKVMPMLAIVFGLAMVGGLVKSDASEPCTVNDKLLDIVKDQQAKLSQMMVDSKKEADNMKKKYEDKLDELNKKGCKP